MACSFIYKVKQRRSWLVPGWVTAMLDFVEDPVLRYNGGSGGMENSVLSVLHRFRHRICLERRECLRDEVKRREGVGGSVTE